MNDVVADVPVVDAPAADIAPDAAPAPDIAPDTNPWHSSAPETWRTDVSAGFVDGDNTDMSDGLNKYLDRYNDLPSALKAGYDASQKIRSGQLSTGLPDDPSDQELSDYREANGIPTGADGYEMSLDDGLILGDEDSRILSGVYDVAHAGNVSTDVMNGMVNAFLQSRETEMDDLHTQDNLDSQQSNKQLREIWGNDSTTNKNMVSNLVGQLPESIQKDFEGARMADGRALFNSPEMMVWLSDVARKLNPAGTVVPNSANPAQAVTDEIASLEERIGSDEWFKDKPAQARYQQLLTAQSGMQR